MRGPEIQRWTFPGGEPWAHFHRTRTGYVVRFPGYADYLVSTDGARVTCRPVPGVGTDTLEHVYRNQVVPLALSRSGQLAFHASAVELHGRAVGFVGESGRGKSTLAAAFGAQGSGFLADDGLVIEERGGQAWAVPGPPSLRLWPDSCAALLPGAGAQSRRAPYSRKQHLRAGDALAHCARALPLGRLYFLGARDCARVKIEPLAASAAVIELVRHSFLLDVGDEALLARHFEGLARIVRGVPCFRLEYPRRFEALEATRRAIRRHAEG